MTFHSNTISYLVLTILILPGKADIKREMFEMLKYGSILSSHHTKAIRCIKEAQYSSNMDRQTTG